MDWILARPLPFPFSLPFDRPPDLASSSSRNSERSVLLTASLLRLPSAPTFFDLALPPSPNQLPPNPQPLLDGSTLVTAPSATTLSSIVPSTASLRVAWRRMLSIDGESEMPDRLDMMDVRRVVCRNEAVGCGWRDMSDGEREYPPDRNPLMAEEEDALLLSVEGRLDEDATAG